MKLIRWKYVVPRVLFIFAIALAVRFGLDPALKWAFVSGGESLVGAKVEVGDLRTSLRTGEIFLKEVAVANPRATMRNLVQSEDARLQVDTKALLHGRLIVNDGTLSGLQFDSERSSSGAIAEILDESAEGTSAIQPWLDSGKALSHQWLDNLVDRLEVDLAGQLQTPKLLKELEERWPEQYESIRTQVDLLQSKSKAIEKDIRSVRDNPLRNLERLSGLQQQLANTQQQITSLQQQIAQLPQQAESDRQAVLAAQQHDKQYLRQQLRLSPINQQGLTETLLGKEAASSLSNALEWISWARRQLPAGKPNEAKRSRGTTVVFTPKQPQYLIKQLILRGSASLGDQLLHLSGTLTDVCSDPELLSEPTRLTLRGTGATNLVVDITVDRREALAKDHFRLHCPQVAMPSRRLGGEKLAIEVAPGAASVVVDLQLAGDTLAGRIDFAQGSVALTPLASGNSKKHVTELLNLALANVQQIEAEVVLGGTIEKPQMKIQSELGTQLAAGINQAAEQLLRQRGQQILAETRKQADQQLAHLNQLRSKAEQELLANLKEGQQVLNQLATLPTGGSRLPGISAPASFPQLGSAPQTETRRK